MEYQKVSGMAYPSYRSGFFLLTAPSNWCLHVQKFILCRVLKVARVTTRAQYEYTYLGTQFGIWTDTTR